MVIDLRAPGLVGREPVERREGIEDPNRPPRVEGPGARNPAGQSKEVERR